MATSQQCKETCSNRNTETKVKAGRGQEVDSMASAELAVTDLEIKTTPQENTTNSNMQNDTHHTYSTRELNTRQPGNTSQYRSQASGQATTQEHFSVEESSQGDKALSKLVIGSTGVSISMYTAAGIRCCQSSHPNLDSFRSELVIGYQSWMSSAFYRAPVSYLLIEGRPMVTAEHKDSTND